LKGRPSARRGRRQPSKAKAKTPLIAYPKLI